jgi:hypothetical protein
MKSNKKHLIYFFVFFILLNACTKENLSISNTTNQAKSGSITKFAIVGNYLYTIGLGTIEVFDITNRQEPKKINSVPTNTNIETIFSYLDRLYLGATDGVHIVDITIPSAPKILGMARHQVGCDPVVARGNIAYSTVLQSRVCNNGINVSRSELMVISTNTLQIINAIPLEEPQGLGYDENYLFVCNGQFGIVIFDITNEINPVRISTIYGINARDLIIDNHTLIVSSDKGYTFYNYDNIYSATKLTEINKN